MIRWFFIVVLFAALQLSFSTRYYDYFVDECNGKNYTITYCHDTIKRLILTVENNNGSIEKFPLSNCIQKNVTIEKYKIYIIVSLAALSSNISNGNCIPVSYSYFGKYKVYIYRVEEDSILKRWLLAPDGEPTNPAVIVNYKSVCLFDGTHCEEGQDFEETFKEPSIREGYFVGERNGKNYTITKYYETTQRLVLTVENNNKSIKKFSLSTCTQKYAAIENYTINSRETHLFFQLRNPLDNKFLVIVSLAALSNDISDGNCMPIADSYFGKYKIYIYRVEDSNILKRWLLTPEGEEMNPVVVTKTKLPIEYVKVYWKVIQIGTGEGDP
ncbi:hypothetical protein FO519_008073, partial [Halicephalobus sp. NKZ332]